MMRTSSLTRVGYFCSYFPREIIYAWGKIPVRGLPNLENRSAAELYVHRNFCALVKSLISAYAEDSAGLDGTIFTDSCDAIRRMGDVWRHYLDVPALDFIEVPRLNDPLGYVHFADILEGLVARLEERFGQPLAAQDLARAIGVVDTQRKLMAELRERRAEGRIGSAQYYLLVRRLLQGEPEEMNRLLREELDAISDAQRDDRRPEGPRIILVGSLWVRPDIAQAVEEAGGTVAFEDTCSDGRDMVPPAASLEGDRRTLLENLAARYLAKPPCPRMRDLPWRMGYLVEEVRRNRASGVICCYYKFCDLFLGEFPALKAALQGIGCPTLLLEDEGEPELSGQQRTRIQAFLEMLP